MQMNEAGLPCDSSYFGQVPHLVNLGSIGHESVGFITVAEYRNLPFKIERVYWTYDTPENLTRGNHAHRELRQLLIAPHGKIHVNLEDDRGQKFCFEIKHPSVGLYIPGSCWRTIQFGQGAVLLCLASMPYSEADYLRDYEEFKRYCRQKNAI